MTRINCVPPSELTNKHLGAEFFEVTRVFTLARPNANVPPTYRLGTGHVTFFYDKLQYIWERWCSLADEMLNRGYTLNEDKLDAVCDKADRSREQHPQLWNSWTPTEEAMQINRQRIKERLEK